MNKAKLFKIFSCVYSHSQNCLNNNRFVFAGEDLQSHEPEKLMSTPVDTPLKESQDPAEAAKKSAARGMMAEQSRLEEMTKTQEVEKFFDVHSPGDLARLIETSQNTLWQDIENKMGSDNLYNVLAQTGAKTLYDVLNIPANVITGTMKFGEGTAVAFTEDASTWQKLAGIGEDALRGLTIALPFLGRLIKPAATVALQTITNPADAQAVRE